MHAPDRGSASLTELLAAALRAESAALVAGDPAKLAAAHARRRHLNLLLGVGHSSASLPRVNENGLP